MSDNTNPRATGEAVADVLQSYANWYHDHVSRGGWTNGSHVDNKRSCEAARLVEMFATHPAPRGRVVVTEAEIAGMKADADAGWDHVELFRDALSHANKIAREHSAIEDGPLTVVRFSTPTWLAFLQSMGKRLALVDEEPEQARGRVVKLLDDWRVVTKDGTWVDQFGKRVWADAECASRNSSKAWANHAPHRVMRVALVDAGEGKTCGACHGEREVSEHECCGNSTSMECCGNSVEVRVSCLFCGDGTTTPARAEGAGVVTDDEIERAAAAMYEGPGGGFGQWAKANDLSREHYSMLARLALTAARAQEVDRG